MHHYWNINGLGWARAMLRVEFMTWTLNYFDIVLLASWKKKKNNCCDSILNKILHLHPKLLNDRMLQWNKVA